jgi:hypothetical protein
LQGVVEERLHGDVRVPASRRSGDGVEQLAGALYGTAVERCLA